MSVSIAYTLTGTGWSECTVTIDDHHSTVTASYLSDALGDLVRAIIRMVEGESDATASFSEEPGEYRWKFFGEKPDRLIVHILEFPQLWGNLPDRKGIQVFEAECTLQTFAGAVVSMLQKILEEYGVKGYKKKWVQHDFPLQEHQKLIRLLNE